MSPGGGKVKLMKRVDLPRPRGADLLTSPEFIALKREVLDAIEEEAMKSFAASTGAGS